MGSKIKRKTKMVDQTEDLSSLLVSKNPTLARMEEGFDVARELSAITQDEIKRQYAALATVTNTPEHEARIVPSPSMPLDANRYIDVLPYSHSLVPLPQWPEDTASSRTNYINANFVPVC
eukprot:TRINITY_DN5001_c0_g1_i3.p2 TRINITY_DN5001_c0_g1~~TRINITY_DN5001_c0_g1_i3.p2  ORF type:complete len:120 (+),score=10.54 TRINITY_DN5001_c0_g1_i3:98-457(+)